MLTDAPFVVLITAPSHGVGKSTLASNLAVYFKALAEDLPVAYLPLDADNAGEAMFCLAERAEHSLADLNAGAALTELLQLGQFGVNYCAAPESTAEPLVGAQLRKALAAADYPGVLLLDVAGDHRDLAELLAIADLVLVPVKDPASLPQIVRLQKTLLAQQGEAEQLWLLPSQLGADGQHPASVELLEFLRFAADERGFQVLKEQLDSDLQVAEATLQLDKPVLTRARQSGLHQQLRQIAELILAQRDNHSSFRIRLRRALHDDLLPRRARRIEMVCPLCGQPVVTGQLHYLEAFPTRRRLLLHRGCLSTLLKETSADQFLPKAALMLVRADVALGGQSGQLRLQVVAADMLLLHTEKIAAQDGWATLVLAATGRCLLELYQQLFVVSAPVDVAQVFSDAWQQQFRAARQQLREACLAENI